jgi:hypothetical protein
MGDFPADAGVGSVVIVEVDPGWVSGCAGLVGEVGLGIGPLLVEGAVESFHFPVGLRTVGTGPLVRNVRPERFGEQL